MVSKCALAGKQKSLPCVSNVVNLRKKSCLLIRNQFLLAFSSGRRGTVLTVDEVFYSDCPVEHHNKSFSSENLTFSLVCKRNYNNSTPHPSPEGATFSHWRRLTECRVLVETRCYTYKSSIFSQTKIFLQIFHFR